MGHPMRAIFRWFRRLAAEHRIQSFSDGGRYRPISVCADDWKVTPQFVAEPRPVLGTTLPPFQHEVVLDRWSCPIRKRDESAIWRRRMRCVLWKLRRISAALPQPADVVKNFGPRPGFAAWWMIRRCFAERLRSCTCELGGVGGRAGAGKWTGQKSVYGECRGFRLQDDLESMPGRRSYLNNNPCFAQNTAFGGPELHVAAAVSTPNASSVLGWIRETTEYGGWFCKSAAGAPSMDPYLRTCAAEFCASFNFGIQRAGGRMSSPSARNYAGSARATSVLLAQQCARVLVQSAST